MKKQERIVQILCLEKNNEACFAKYQGHDLGIIYYNNIDNVLSFYKRSEKPAAKRWAEKIRDKGIFIKVTVIERVV